MHNTHDPQVLPMRDGVKPSCVVLPMQGQGSCLDYLADRLDGVSREVWAARMVRGDVVDELGRRVQPDTSMLHGLRIYYYREVQSEPAVPFEADVLYQDGHIVVADKPHFLPVMPGGKYLQNTLLIRLKNQLNLPDLSPVHRIDRDTAGLVLFSIHKSERGAYQALFRERTVHKSYEAIAPYHPAITFPREHASCMVESDNFIRMQEVQGAPNSFTRMQLLEHNARWARYLLEPISGKRHQLRVHMAGLGLGLKGDGLYPVVDDAPEGDFSRPLMLLARTLAFTDPITGEMRAFATRRNLGDLPQASA